VEPTYTGQLYLAFEMSYEYIFIFASLTVNKSRWMCVIFTKSIFWSQCMGLSR